MKYYNTLIPYKILPHTGIQYSVCRDFNHICRYRNLRRIVHNPNESDRFVSLETPNAFKSAASVTNFIVPSFLEHRLDVISYQLLGDATYSWILSYINKISDGFSAVEGQTLSIPKSITQFFDKGELLEPINPIQLNLGEE